MISKYERRETRPESVQQENREKPAQAAKRSDAPAGGIPAELVTLLRDSILNLNQKFDTFSNSVTDKIDKIERNYDDLSLKIDSLAPKTQKDH